MRMIRIGISYGILEERDPSGVRALLETIFPLPPRG
jgi:hypothetical protein